MNHVAAFFVGAVMGVAEFALTAGMIRSLSGRMPFLFLYVMGKLLLWGVFFGTVVLLMRDSIVWAGIGAAAALIAAGVFGFLRNRRKQSGRDEQGRT